ncbi:hypothetical protein V7266_03410 [Neobacillus drentensis]
MLTAVINGGFYFLAVLMVIVDFETMLIGAESERQSGNQHPS